MAFVNEYISDEDVAKYGIAQLRDEFHAYRQEKFYWTIDRERDAYLMQMRLLVRDFEPEVWLLYEQGRYCAVMLHRGGVKNWLSGPIACCGILKGLPRHGGTGALFRQ